MTLSCGATSLRKPRHGSAILIAAEKDASKTRSISFWRMRVAAGDPSRVYRQRRHGVSAASSARRRLQRCRGKPSPRGPYSSTHHCFDSRALQSTLSSGRERIAPKIEVEVRATFHSENLNSVNVIGELVGGSKKDEVVMLGGHLDSVGSGLRATDNGAGCAVMMEAMRSLKVLDLPLKRTVRIALWGGEEEGFMGSTAYVKQHFGDSETMTLRSGHAKLAGYFNVDNGTGKIRGVSTGK